MECKEWRLPTEAEWVWDKYENDYFERSPSVDPLGSEKDHNQLRISKGGAWQSSAHNVVPSVRWPHGRGETGFRLVRSAE